MAVIYVYLLKFKDSVKKSLGCLNIPLKTLHLLPMTLAKRQFTIAIFVSLASWQPQGSLCSDILLVQEFFYSRKAGTKAFTI